MKKKIITAIVCIITGVTALLLAVLIALTFYYREGFGIGTWINGIYCTGKDVVQVNSEISEQFSVPTIILYDQDGAEYSLDATKMELTYDFQNEITDLWRAEQAKPWFERLSWNTHYRVTPKTAYNEELLREQLNSLPIVQAEAERPAQRVWIQKTEQGYVLMDETKNILNVDKMYETVASCLSNGVFEIPLSEYDCYQDETYTQEMLHTMSLFEQVQEFQDFTMTLHFGDVTEVIDAGVVSNWISVQEDGSFYLDESGRLVLDEAGVAAYVDTLGERYDTYERPHQFLTTAGDLKTIESKTYGNLLNRSAQTEALIEAYRNHETGTEQEPVYSKRALFQGTDDIGPTYIEIDMTNQKLYLYIERELVLETDVVTGNLKWKLGTPEMICSVYGKYRNRVLRGPGYESPVSYWVPIYKNIGIHDASWRRNFGGDIYKTNGSHGCINIPKDIMPDIYSQIELGTPVILYY